MTILITGGDGFIGLNVTENLLKQGKSVLSVGLRPLDKKVEHYLHQLGATYHHYICDICDEIALASVFEKTPIAKIVHTAALTAGLEREATEAHRIFSVNVGGTINVLKLAQQHQVQRVVQLGTGSVFGEDVKESGHLIVGEDHPVPDSFYGISKYAAERIGCRFRDTKGLDVVVARVGVAFGQWEHQTGVRDTLSIPYQLMHYAQTGETARVYHNVPLDWIYAKDVANAINLLLETPVLNYEIYQIASGDTWDLYDWCERINEISPTFNYEIVEDKAMANIGRVTPSPRPPFDISRLQEIGYQPMYLASNAINDYSEWMKLWGFPN